MSRRRVPNSEEKGGKNKEFYAKKTEWAPGTIHKITVDERRYTVKRLRDAVPYLDEDTGPRKKKKHAKFSGDKKMIVNQRNYLENLPVKNTVLNPLMVLIVCRCLVMEVKLVKGFCAKTASMCLNYWERKK